METYLGGQLPPKRLWSPINSAAALWKMCSYRGKKHQKETSPTQPMSCSRCALLGARKRDIFTLYFYKVCRAPLVVSKSKSSNAVLMEIKDKCLSDAHSKLNMSVNGVEANALVDNGITLSHVSDRLVKRLKLTLERSDHCVGLAAKGLNSQSLGTCEITVNLCGQVYGNVRVTVLKDLLTDVVLGQDFMQRHQNVNIHFGGSRPTLNLSVLRAAVPNAPVRLFEHLSDDCHPIATKER